VFAKPGQFFFRLELPNFFEHPEHIERLRYLHIYYGRFDILLFRFNSILLILNSISRSACLNNLFYKFCLFLNVRKYTPSFLSFSSSDKMLRCLSIMEFITLTWEQVHIIFYIMTVSFSFSWGLRGHAFMPFTGFVKAARVCSGG
jgi:hypothetical protein